MSGFEARWRTLATSARRAAEPPVGMPPPGLARSAVEALGIPRVTAWWRPWLGPVAAMVLLYALALPLVDGALAATASLRVSLQGVPRPPSLPSPPLPHAPLLPKPPSLPRTSGALAYILAPKEARP